MRRELGASALDRMPIPMTHSPKVFSIYFPMGRASRGSWNGFTTSRPEAVRNTGSYRVSDTIRSLNYRRA